MNFWNRWRNKMTLRQTAESEREEFIRELEQAKKEWINARSKLDHVLDKEQIDYAIYSLEAAEHRYNMLLKKAKQQKILISMDEWNVDGIVMFHGKEEEQA